MQIVISHIFETKVNMFFSLNFEEVGGPRVPPQGHCRARFRLSLLVVAANEVPFYCSSSSSIFFLLSFFFLHIPMARLHTSLSASPTIRSHRRPHRRPSRPPTARIAASSAPSGLRRPPPPPRHRPPIVLSHPGRWRPCLAADSGHLCLS